MLFAFTACEKENLNVIEDEIPEVEPEVVIENDEEILFLSGIYTPVDSAVGLTQYVLDGQNNIVGITGFPIGVYFNESNFFQVTLLPQDDEQTAIQEGAYEIGYAAAYNQDALDAIQDWNTNGGDPGDYPTDLVLIEEYDGSSVEAEVMDVQLGIDFVDYPDGIPDLYYDQATLQLTGEIVSDSGNTISVSGTFTTILLRFEN